MTYPYVPAYYDYGLRTRPVLAFIGHMAEGGGTVGYLSRANPNGVSVHYVIEYSGRIVQMLKESRISGSLRPSAIRTTDDPPFTSPDGVTVVFGASAAKAALERYWSDPNTVVLSCEIEGFAASGPNAAQATALSALVADLRTRYPKIALLAHRDFADYKGCPGKLIPWGRLGGHGVPLPDSATEETMTTYVDATKIPPRAWSVPSGVTLNGYDPRQPGKAVKSAIGATGSADAEVYVSYSAPKPWPVPNGGPFLRVTAGPLLGLLVVKALVTLAPEPPDPTPFAQTDLNVSYNKGLDAAEAAVAAAPRR